MKISTILLIIVLVSLSRSFQFRSPTSPYHSNTQYNATHSKRTLFIALSAGCPQKCLASWDCKVIKQYPGVRQLTHIKNQLTSLVGFVAYDSEQNQIITSWRGSADIRNWLEDFTFDTVEFPYCKGCRIHAGFYEMYRTNEKQINQAFDILIRKYPTAKILTTGHSMGAALAVVSAIQLAMKYNIPREQIQIHNFGCPRLGNPSFAAFVDSKIGSRFRVVHYKDLIPHIPQQQFLYHHVANQIFWDKDFKTFQVCNDSGQDPKCSNKFAPDYTIAQHDFYFVDFQGLSC